MGLLGSKCWNTSFYDNVNTLDRLDWNAIAATDFRDPIVKDGKQAEFLLYGIFPWALVHRVGTYDASIAQSATEAMIAAKHKPVVSVERGWYY